MVAAVLGVKSLQQPLNQRRQSQIANPTINFVFTRTRIALEFQHYILGFSCREQGVGTSDLL